MRLRISLICPDQHVIYDGHTPATCGVGGGVTARVIHSPDYFLAYQPSDPAANAQGMVAAPNIDLASQMVNQLSASLAFQANAKLFRIADHNQKVLLDMLA